jgi:hypothetical protein
MPAEHIGKKVLFHDANGDHVGFICDYEAGRDAGDHLIRGFSNDKGVVNSDDGTDLESLRLFSCWSVFREDTEDGTFRFANN